MKRKILQKIGLCLVTISLLGNGFGQKNEEALKVTYKLITNTSYNVDESFKDTMSLFHKIRFSPFTEERTYEEIFYQNGESEKTIFHNYPNGMREKWQIMPTKTVFTLDSAFVYANDSKITSIKLSETELIPASEGVPLYLGTVKWKLPLNEEKINELTLAGFKIIRNDSITIHFKNEEMSIIKDKFLMIEEYIQYDEGGQKKSSQMYAFTLDNNGYYVYDFVVYRTLDCDDESIPCVERVVYTKYENIVRDYIDPSLEPSESNGYGTQEEINYPSITASQMGGTKMIQVNFSEDCPDQLIINVHDLQGNPKLTNVIVTRDNNSFFAENMFIGVHTITIQNHTVLPCTFMYIP